MKNPNGYGTVVKLSGNRRKPYAVRKTVGYTDKGYPIYKAIGYTETKAEGLMLLAEYNRNPYDIDLHNVTVEDVYKKLSERNFPKMSQSAVKASKSAWNHLKGICNIKYNELKAYQMQECIDNCSGGYSTKGSIKTLFYHLDRFALELDIIIKCNSTLISAPPIPETKKKVFTDEEIQALWNIQDTEWVDSVLILLYMGWRISELLSIKRENIDMENGTITAGTKTKNGKNRIVPIHPRIMPFIQQRYQNKNEYLFDNDNKKYTSGQYYIFWNKIMDTLKIEHTPHECRHTFRSKLDSAGANKVCIDLLMGHKSKDVGERVLE